MRFLKEVTMGAFEANAPLGKLAALLPICDWRQKRLNKSCCKVGDRISLKDSPSRLCISAACGLVSLPAKQMAFFCPSVSVYTESRYSPLRAIQLSSDSTSKKDSYLNKSQAWPVSLCIPVILITDLSVLLHLNNSKSVLIPTQEKALMVSCQAGTGLKVWYTCQVSDPLE